MFDPQWVDALRPKQDVQHFADNILKAFLDLYLYFTDVCKGSIDKLASTGSGNGLALNR